MIARWTRGCSHGGEARLTAFYDAMAAGRGDAPKRLESTNSSLENGSFGRRGRPVRTSGAFRGAHIAHATRADVGAGRGIEGAPNKPARPGGSALTPCCCTAPCTLQAAPRLVQSTRRFFRGSRPAHARTAPVNELAEHVLMRREIDSHGHPPSGHPAPRRRNFPSAQAPGGCVQGAVQQARRERWRPA